MNNAAPEWVVLDGKTAVIADEEGACWFLDLEDSDAILPFSRPMTGRGTRKSSTTLLDAAIALGAAPEAASLPTRPMTLANYVLDLVGSYHNSSRTVGNYLKAAKRFREIDRPDLAAYLERHAREEHGHERLALRDLRALGLPAERIVENLIPDGVAALCDLFDRLSSTDHPVGCIGYSYFFESAAAKKSRADVEARQALCPDGVDASRFVRAHSSLASEADHVRDMIDFIAGLPASDRIEIVKAAYTTAVVASAGIDRDGPRSDEEIWSRIRAAAGEEIALAS